MTQKSQTVTKTTQNWTTLIEKHHQEMTQDDIKTTNVDSKPQKGF